MEEQHFWKYILTVLSLVVLIYLKNYVRMVILAFSIPGPPALPILGNVLLINDYKKLTWYADNITSLYGSLMRSWVSILPFFWIYEPRHLQIILGSSKYSEKNLFYKFMHNFIGEGLITNNGYKWKLHRKLIQPYFHINVLDIFVDSFTYGTNQLLEKLKDQEEDVKITPFINDCVLNMLHDAILGVRDKDQIKDSPFRKGEVVVPYRATRPWLLWESLFKFTASAKKELQQKSNLQNYARKILEQKRHEIKTDCTSTSLMDMLITISEANPEFTEEDIINEACTFMLAGQDSVGSTVAFTLYYLAKHQDIQQKVLEEISAIFSGENRDPNLNDLTEMKYLEQCIKESMRLCPSVPFISRVLTEDVALGKFVFPTGTNLFLSPFVTHRLPHVFPDPLEYKPERFSQENIKNMHPYAFLPFSAGPRNCIGYKFALLEIKTVISAILRHYQLNLVPGHAELNIAYRITLRAQGGIWIRLSKRNLNINNIEMTNK